MEKYRIKLIILDYFQSALNYIKYQLVNSLIF